MTAKPVPDWDKATGAQREAARLGQQPIILRGLVRHWPLVEKGLAGIDQLTGYLLRFDQGKPFQAMIAPASVGGRLFYTDDLKGFNFDRMNGRLVDAMAIFKSLIGKSPCPGFYIGSKPVVEYLSGLEKENNLAILQEVEPTIWFSNAVTVATHNDLSENIACVAAGRRRFTLFPPEQEVNLYLGPQDKTPAGRPVSLVDLKSPDFQRFPRFQEALDHAQMAELEAGDAIYIPTRWWHNVESLADFNILVNYWWKGSPPSL